MLGKQGVEAPNFSWGSGFFRTRENSGSHPIPGFSPGLKAVDFITLTIFETRSSCLYCSQYPHVSGSNLAENCIPLPLSRTIAPSNSCGESDEPACTLSLCV